MSCKRQTEKYSSYSLLTSALDWGEWSASRPGRALPPVNDSRYPLDSGWASELVWTQKLEKKSFASAGDRTSDVKSIVRHYTDWVAPGPTDWIRRYCLDDLRLQRAKVNSKWKPQQGKKQGSGWYSWWREQRLHRPTSSHRSPRRSIWQSHYCSYLRFFYIYGLDEVNLKTIYNIQYTIWTK
jgi:hypothetical protein